MKRAFSQFAIQLVLTVGVSAFSAMVGVGAGIATGEKIVLDQAEDANKIVTESVSMVLRHWGDLLPMRHSDADGGQSCVGYNPDSGSATEAWPIGGDGRCHVRDFLVREFEKAVDEKAKVSGPPLR